VSRLEQFVSADGDASLDSEEAMSEPGKPASFESPVDFDEDLSP
jgi:hypothetical protein